MPDYRASNPVLDESWLKRAAWWVRHRAQLKGILVGVILIVSGVFILYSLYVWVDFWGLSREREQRMYADLTRSTNYAALHENLQAASLRAPVVVVLSGSGREGRWDVLTKLVNPNAKWLATVTFKIVSSDGTSSPDQTVTLLNNEEYFVVTRGAAQSPGASVRADFVNVSWQRIRDPEALNERKPKFTVSDVKFLSAAELRLSGDLGLSQVQFTVANESINGFWSVDFSVVLLQGESAVAAGTTTLDRFAGGERRDVAMNLYTTIPTVTDVLVVPHVNVADEGVFMDASNTPIKF